MSQDSLLSRLVPVTSLNNFGRAAADLSDALLGKS
jgi:hypothetical protein